MSGYCRETGPAAFFNLKSFRQTLVPFAVENGAGDLLAGLVFVFGFDRPNLRYIDSIVWAAVYDRRIARIAGQTP